MQYIVAPSEKLRASLCAGLAHYFGWLYILSIVAFIGFCVWIAVGKRGNIKLGKNDDKPEFSAFSWPAMLFFGSIGIGLVFWSILRKKSLKF